MKRILPLLVFSFLFVHCLRAQVTEIVPNKGLELVVPLSAGKALLVEPGMKKLWVTDGSVAGTFKLSDNLMYEDIGGLLGDKYIFAATSAGIGTELWITDGTVAGTKLVKDINPGLPSSEPQDDFVLLNGYLYFSASTVTEGRELWRTNGTEAGTTLVKDIIPGPAGSALEGWYDLYSNGTYLLFRVATTAEGYELWRSDGTDAGTFLLKDINPGTAGSDPAGYHAYNGTVLFWAQTAAEGRELWRTDGTNAGTQLVKDIRPGTASSINVAFPMPNISLFRPLGNQLLFVANDGTTGEEIWKTDGTAAGTILLKDINPGPATSLYSMGGAIGALMLSVAMNNKLYFTAFAEGLGGELWETDGTPAGTKLFKEILPGPDGGIPFLMPNFRITPGVPWLSHEGNQFYFMFGQPVDGVELWKSDGTEAGTVKVKTIKTDGNDFGNLSYVYTTAGLYFSVDDGEDGDELWKSDGTEAGTVKVLDLNPGPEGSEISFFPIAVSGRVLFTATNGDDEFMHDLYRLDGAMIPLPVRLETFNATLAGADGKLQWTTSVEQGTDAFVIERSSNGQQFSRIGSVSAAGNSASRRHYTFTDLGVTHNGLPVVYYRLRMIDKDGKEAYSSVVKLQIKSGTPFSVQLLGNPVQQEIRLSLPQTSAPIQITIRDAAGRTVKAAQVKNENNIFTMPATGLAPGNYFLTVESNGQAGVVKFIKQ